MIFLVDFNLSHVFLLLFFCFQKKNCSLFRLDSRPL
jgi:hypothetical protein